MKFLPLLSLAVIVFNSAELEAETELTWDLNEVGQSVTCDVGSVYFGLGKEIPIKIRNSTRTYLTFDSVKATCSCVSLRLPRTSLAPGEQTQAKLSISPIKLVNGNNLQKLTIANDAKEPIFEVSIKFDGVRPFSLETSLIFVRSWEPEHEFNVCVTQNFGVRPLEKDHFVSGEFDVKNLRTTKTADGWKHSVTISPKPSQKRGSESHLVVRFTSGDRTYDYPLVFQTTDGLPDIRPQVLNISFNEANPVSKLFVRSALLVGDSDIGEFYTLKFVRSGDEPLLVDVKEVVGAGNVRVVKFSIPRQIYEGNWKLAIEDRNGQLLKSVDISLN